MNKYITDDMRGNKKKCKKKKKTYTKKTLACNEHWEPARQKYKSPGS